MARKLVVLSTIAATVAANMLAMPASARDTRPSAVSVNTAAVAQVPARASTKVENGNKLGTVPLWLSVAVSVAVGVGFAAAVGIGGDDEPASP